MPQLDRLGLETEPEQRHMCEDEKRNQTQTIHYAMVARLIKDKATLMGDAARKACDK